MACSSANASALDCCREPTATTSASGSSARSRVKSDAIPPVPMMPKRTGVVALVMGDRLGGTTGQYARIRSANIGK